MKIKEFLLQKVNKDTFKKESVQRAIKVTICCAFIFTLIFQLVGCLFSPLSVFAVETITLNKGIYRFNNDLNFDDLVWFPDDDRYAYVYDFPFIAINPSLEFYTEYNQIVIVTDYSNYTMNYYGNNYEFDEVYVTNYGGWQFSHIADCQTLFLTSDLSVDYTFGTWFLANTNYIDVIAPCPTLPELLRDYTGSFDSIVDMLNSTNYDQYEETIRFFEERAYNEGVSASFGENLLGATFNAPLTALNQWVLFETTGGLEITMGGVFSGLLALSILIILIKMFAGG